MDRAARYISCTSQEFRSEVAVFAHLDRFGRRTPPFLVLLDTLGKQLSSEEFAATVLSVANRGLQQMVFAIGPASGWSADARGRADLLISLGKMTLPHELAAVVLAEQLYRALTINAGHPYHLGH